MTESKQFVPSGYSGLNTADLVPGSRPQKYVEFLWTTDPLADAVMDEFAALPEPEWRALLELALAKGLDAVPQTPEPLQALPHSHQLYGHEVISRTRPIFIQTRRAWTPGHRSVLPCPRRNQHLAGGDCAAVPHPDGGTCPPLAHYAQKAGSNIGGNILRTTAGKPLQPYSFNGLGEACTLGHRSAIAHRKGIPASGFLAWIGWRFIVLTMFVPSWTRRVRLMFDWWLTLILGRDVVNPRMNERGAIWHALYEPGQIIVAAGETRRYHYLVESGQLDVVASDGHGEQILQSLKSGDYFGEGARPKVDCCIRVRTRVRLLAIDTQVAEALSAVRPDAALLLKQGTSSTAAGRTL